MLSLFDLHCDTAYEMYKRKQSLQRNDLAVSLQDASVFDRYTQVMALWTDRSLSDERGWQQMHRMLRHLLEDETIRRKDMRLATDAVSLDSHKRIFFLGIEDARILAGDASRVDRLFDLGIRFLTPLWSGETCIGGSHDTASGLTAFGRAALNRATARGMLCDISHASEASAENIFSIADQYASPVLATHSNAYAVCPVSRNLRDWQIREILRTGGLIGLNLYPPFLKKDGTEHALESVLPHIEHFLTLGAENALALGCDMDGGDLPPDIPSLSALPRLAEQLSKHGYSDALIDRIFYRNAAEFAKKHLT